MKRFVTGALIIPPSWAASLASECGVSRYQAAALLVIEHLGEASTEELRHQLRPNCGPTRPIQCADQCGAPSRAWLHERLATLEFLGLLIRERCDDWREQHWRPTAKLEAVAARLKPREVDG